MPPSSPPPPANMDERSREEEAKEREKWASAPVHPGDSGLVRAAMESKFIPPPSSQASLKVGEAEDTWWSTVASVRVRRWRRSASVGEMERGEREGDFAVEKREGGGVIGGKEAN